MPTEARDAKVMKLMLTADNLFVHKVIRNVCDISKDKNVTYQRVLW